MAVISITVEESPKQIVSGIPETITLSTNIPANIFYTTDGSDPTILSDIYIEPILLPTYYTTLTVKLLADNGVDSSGIIELTYYSNILQNARLPKATTNTPPGEVVNNIAMCSDGSDVDIAPIFLNPGDAGPLVSDPAYSLVSNGYDGQGGENNFTNSPFNVENYDIVYSESDAEGRRGEGLGTLPATVSFPVEPEPPEQSYQYTALFDPRSPVIFQDFTNMQFADGYSHINKAQFSLVNNEDNPNAFYSSGLDCGMLTGSIIRQYINTDDKTVTSYYRDSYSNKWIIAKSKYNDDQKPLDNLHKTVISRDKGIGIVFQWIPGFRRVIF